MAGSSVPELVIVRFRFEACETSGDCWLVRIELAKGLEAELGSFVYSSTKVTGRRPEENEH